MFKTLFFSSTLTFSHLCGHSAVLQRGKGEGGMYSICWELLWSLGVVSSMICYSTWNLLRTLLLVKQQLFSLPIWSQYDQQDLFLFLFFFFFLIPSKQLAFNTILSITGFVPACGNYDELWCRMFEPLSNVQPAALMHRCLLQLQRVDKAKHSRAY